MVGGSERGPTWRRVAAIAITGLALALAGCGGGGGAGPSPTPPPSGGGQIGDAPSGTSTTPAPAETTTQSGGGGGGGAPTYPKEAGPYAVELMKAVSAQNMTRVNLLAEQGAALQATGGHGQLAGGWVVYSCSSPDANNMTGCTVRNDHGDDARVTVRGSQLGAPTAVTNVVLDLTTYPSSPEAYVGEMLRGRDNDNRQRVARLSNSTMFNKLTCYIAGKQASTEPIDGTTSKVTISGVGADLGKQMQFKVLTSPGGKANAVKELLSSQCG
jgi:hypothetical protein